MLSRQDSLGKGSVKNGLSSVTASSTTCSSLCLALLRAWVLKTSLKEPEILFLPTLDISGETMEFSR